jgi:translation initiation factor 3 subunit F
MEDVSVILTAAASVRVHPVVIFNILDHYIRRNEGQDRVIGTLLGVNYEGTIEVRNSFPVPHTEGDQVAVDMEFHRNMFDLHQKTAPKEVIVGWYATGLDITENSVMIHEFYGREVSVPPVVHVLVDTGLTNDTLGIKAFTGTPISFAEKALGSYFQPVALEITTLEVDRVGFEVLSRTKTDGVTSLVADMENLEGSVSRLLQMIESVSEYVDGVVNGKIPADNAIGRFLSKSVSLIPKFDAESMERVLNNSVQDLLMVVYLANLTRTQIALAEKLQRTLP